MLYKNHFRLITFFLIIILPGLSANAQSTEVRGKILNESNLPMPGVSVYSKGTPWLGTISDSNGEYIITAELNSTLVYSFIGYQTAEQLVTSSQIDLTMEVESIGLEEVVAI